MFVMCKLKVSLMGVKIRCAENMRGVVSDITCDKYMVLLEFPARSKLSFDTGDIGGRDHSFPAELEPREVCFVGVQNTSFSQ